MRCGAGYGNSLVPVDAMPEIFSPKREDVPWQRTTSNPLSENWLARAQARIADTEPAKPEASESPADAWAVREDFVWSTAAPAMMKCTAN